MGKEEIAQDLSQTIVKVIISSVLGYLLKAFWETYAEKKNKLNVEIYKHNKCKEQTIEGEEIEETVEE